MLYWFDTIPIGKVLNNAVLNLKRNVKFYYFLFMLLVQKQALYICGGRVGVGYALTWHCILKMCGSFLYM